MNTRKALILSIPAFVVTLVVLVAVLALMFTSGPATAPVETDQAVIETPVSGEDVIVTEEPAESSEAPAAPTIIYQNEE